MGEQYSPDYSKYVKPENLRSYHTQEKLEKRKYLAKHLESPATENNQTALDSESTFIYSESGSSELEKNGCTIDISYEPYQSSRLQDISSLYNNINLHEDANDWRYLKSFIITNPDTGAAINIQDILPEGYQIVFNPFSKKPSRCCDYEKAVVVGNDPTTLQGLIVMLHEIGHSIDPEKQKAWSARATGFLHMQYNSESDEVYYSILKSERNAWAFALGQLRKLSNQGKMPAFLNVEKIKKQIHEIALETYSKKMRQSIEGAIKDDM